ncbi:MAG: type II toxin-antitoxin system VapC family toxin [Nitrospiria bacterium]
MRVLVDSNVILDVVTRDKIWSPWSESMLRTYGDQSTLVINPIIFAEVSIGFKRIEEVEEVLPPDYFERAPLPWEAAFLAGKCFLSYRKKGGKLETPLPDFFIGAHAAVEQTYLLTRDRLVYQTYFPSVRLITPLQAP